MKSLYCTRWIVPFTLLTAVSFLVAGCGKAEVEKAKDAANKAADEAKAAAESAKDSATDAASAASDALSAGFTAAADKAAKALEGVEGGGALLAELKEMFTSATSTLEGITDKATAEAAVAKIEELGTSADKMAESAAKMPEEAMTAIGGVVESGIEQLKALVEKLMANSEIQEVLKPKLDELMAKLQKLAGA